MECTPYIVTGFNSTEANDKCPPACFYQSYKQKHIQYANLPRPDKTVATVVIELINREAIIHEEREVYTANKLQADLGGAAGLVLGLNTVVFLEFFSKILTIFYRSYVKAWNAYMTDISMSDYVQR